MTKSFGLPYIGNFENALKLSSKERDDYINEVFEYLEKHPKEPYYYIGTGDTMVFGFNHEDEIIVIDCIHRREISVSKR